MSGLMLETLPLYLLMAALSLLQNHSRLRSITYVTQTGPELSRSTISVSTRKMSTKKKTNRLLRWNTSMRWPILFSSSLDSPPPIAGWAWRFSATSPMKSNPILAQYGRPIPSYWCNKGSMTYWAALGSEECELYRGLDDPGTQYCYVDGIALSGSRQTHSLCDASFERLNTQRSYPNGLSWGLVQ